MARCHNLLQLDKRVDAVYIYLDIIISYDQLIWISKIQITDHIFLTMESNDTVNKTRIVFLQWISYTKVNKFKNSKSSRYVLAKIRMSREEFFAIYSAVKLL